RRDSHAVSIPRVAPAGSTCLTWSFCSIRICYQFRFIASLTFVCSGHEINTPTASLMESAANSRSFTREIDVLPSGHPHFANAVQSNAVLVQLEMERRDARVIEYSGRVSPVRKPRKSFTPAEKVATLRRHLIDRVPISDLCDKYQLSPALFY